MTSVTLCRVRVFVLPGEDKNNPERPSCRGGGGLHVLVRGLGPLPFLHSVRIVAMSTHDRRRLVLPGACMCTTAFVRNISSMCSFGCSGTVSKWSLYSRTNLRCFFFFFFHQFCRHRPQRSRLSLAVFSMKRVSKQRPRKTCGLTLIACRR